jgi:TPR repeat protein
MLIWRLRARIGYWVARRLLRWGWPARLPRLWSWMEGQFSRLAASGDRNAQSYYGHILLFRGQGRGARQEGRRLLRLAAEAGDAKSAYQLGVLNVAGELDNPADPVEAAHWWQKAAAAGHPLANRRLAELYRTGAPGLPADADKARSYATEAERLGL